MVERYGRVYPEWSMRGAGQESAAGSAASRIQADFASFGTQDYAGIIGEIGASSGVWAHAPWSSLPWDSLTPERQRGNFAAFGQQKYSGAVGETGLASEPWSEAAWGQEPWGKTMPLPPERAVCGAMFETGAM